MSELKILSNHPSIQNIEDQSQACIKEYVGLSACDMNRLFKGIQFPKFELMDLRTNSFLLKHDKGRFFLIKLQKWNASIDEEKKLKINSRTQFLQTQFVYSSLKRICILPENQMEQQLEMLYKWYTCQSKINDSFSKVKMPCKVKQNQFYDIKKSYKTNPTLLIQQYHRPRFLIKQLKNYDTQRQNNPVFFRKDLLAHKNLSKKCLSNNFLTEVQDFTSKGQKTKKCIIDDFPNLKSAQSKARQDEMRRYLQKKQLELQQWNFKVKKGRLISQTTKNYYEGSFTIAPRCIKTSEQSRQSLKSQTIQQIKRLRVKTSIGKRLHQIANPGQQKNEIGYEINQIYSIGLLANPLERKTKKKKKYKK